MKDWIKRSTHDFSDSDFPIWLGKSDTGQVQLWMTGHDMRRCEPLWDLCTHWKSARADFPEAPAEPTQREKDAEVFGRNFGTDPTTRCCDEQRVHGHVHEKMGWDAALKYERDEVLKLLNRLAVCGKQYKPFGEMSEAAFNELRVRCSP